LTALRPAEALFCSAACSVRRKVLAGQRLSQELSGMHFNLLLAWSECVVANQRLIRGGNQYRGARYIASNGDLSGLDAHA
jgi:hypothetical protein